MTSHRDEVSPLRDEEFAILDERLGLNVGEAIDDQLQFGVAEVVVGNTNADDAKTPPTPIYSDVSE